jgi:hypothetical protein
VVIFNAPRDARVLAEYEAAGVDTCLLDLTTEEPADVAAELNALRRLAP